MIELAIVKKHCNIDPDFDEDDDLLTIYTETAHRYVENITRRKLYEAADSEGYDDDLNPLVIDSLIISAMLQLISHWYENRETINIGNITSEIPITTNMLLQPYIIYGV